MVNAAGYVHLGAVLDCTGREWDFHSISTSNLCTPRSMYSAGYAQERRWVDHQLVLGFSFNQRSVSLLLRRHQGHRDRTDQGVDCDAVCHGKIDSPSFEERVTAVSKQSEALVQIRAHQFNRITAHGTPGNIRGGRGVGDFSRVG
jgi:hypothetical protein